MDNRQEELEGLDDESKNESLSDYPLDAVMVRNETRTVGDVVSRMEKGRYILNPDFQRAFVWKDDKQSRLIESCVMRIPLPVFYVAEGHDGRVIVVDGLQRLTTFKRFLEGNLRLQLDTKHPLNGRTFKDVPLNLQERIEDTQLTLYILDKDAPDRARLDIFERVNSGVPLTRQQMRNALYGGLSTQWLANEAATKIFKTVTGGSLRADTMRDREAINRFCAFQLLGWSKYLSSDMDTFLADALKKMNLLSPASLEELRLRFRRTLQTNWMLFGEHSFRKSLSEGNRNAWRSVINISLFDVCSVILGRIAETTLAQHGAMIQESVVNLMRDEDFLESITYSTNSTRQVHNRFRIMEQELKGHLQ